MSARAAGHPAPLPVAEPPRWLWLWFPPLLVLVELGVRIYDQGAYTRWFDTELGVVELATPLASTLGVVAGILALRYHALLPARWLTVWVALVTLACVYLTGEELSWGQHLFGWSTPESLMAVNDQGETNIHNISSWFDQKPRMLLELFVLYGGIIRLPWYRPAAADWRSWLWPTHICLPTAVLAILIRVPDRLEDLFGIGPLPYAIRWSEPQEYYFALFLCLYLLSILLRARRGGVAASAT
jgi:hypothetical protein